MLLSGTGAGMMLVNAYHEGNGTRSKLMDRDLENACAKTNRTGLMAGVFGDSGYPLFIAGPCAVENYEMLDQITGYLISKNIHTIRAGAFKPRTSPEDFQGLGVEGLAIIDKIRRKYKVKVVSEIVDAKYLDLMLKTCDILQVGARNMQNYELLKALGRTDVPIILKRGYCATIKEFIHASGYIARGGNHKILMCERGIRSFDSSTRNLLDLSCVALLKEQVDYPIIVDLSHSLGRKDIALPMARAALAAGADALMVEVHNKPETALSDAGQQMSFPEFDRILDGLSRESIYLRRQ